MIKTSKKINLEQLDKELGSQGLCADFNNAKEVIIIVAENSIVTEKELEKAIENHIAEPTQEELRNIKKSELLAKLGITADEAKLLLA